MLINMIKIMMTRVMIMWMTVVINIRMIMRMTVKDDDDKSDDNVDGDGDKDDKDADDKNGDSVGDDVKSDDNEDGDGDKDDRDDDDDDDKGDDSFQVQQKHVDEEQLARVISQKLLERPGVSFSEIASVALEHGRKQLAVKVS